ncbi:MAG: hypothetical protein K2K29_03805, partial [Muribaculaceae bacterium]|nr:hypothetical protein [Muribaculaceae bacterium]
MIEFVNAKINIGLNIVGKRADGYHDLETVFYPVGLRNGMPAVPYPFCDVMEISERNADDPEGYELRNVRFIFGGDSIDCDPEKNLVVKGVKRMIEYSEANGMKIDLPPLTMRLEKHLPSGAGMGGGSADCVAAMKLMRLKLQEYGYAVPDDDMLRGIAAGLGADCAVFVANRAAYAEGIGDVLEPLEDFLAGKWVVVVKPDIFISTAAAFAGVTVARPAESLRRLIERPIEEWKDCIVNDFEPSLFPVYPELARLKTALYAEGAIYASMTGSGAALYGIFHDEETAQKACLNIDAPYKT